MDTGKLEVEDSKPQLTFSPTNFISHLAQPILSMQFNKYSLSIWWYARHCAHAVAGTKVGERWSLVHVSDGQGEGPGRVQK